MLQFPECLPVESVNAMVHYFRLAALVYHNWYTTGGHRFHGGNSKMLKEYWSHVRIFSIPRRVPENTCAFVKIGQLVPINIGFDVCAARGGESGQSFDISLVLWC